MPSGESMQDWPYEVADPKRLEEFLNVLRINENSDVRYTLMDMVLQSLEDSKLDLSNSEIVDDIENYLKMNFEDHVYQIWYWSVFDPETTDSFRISPLMRKIWSNEVRV